MHGYQHTALNFAPLDAAGLAQGQVEQVLAFGAGFVRQVLLNLLSNALKYTRTRDQAVIEVRAVERPGEWVIEIQDNGVGFDPRYSDKLFRVFQRMHRQDEFEGTGVGLANVRRIIARHGGQVWAKGAVGEGATFSFSLPKAAL